MRLLEEPPPRPAHEHVQLARGEQHRGGARRLGHDEHSRQRERSETVGRVSRVSMVSRVDMVSTVSTVSLANLAPKSLPRAAARRHAGL